MCASFPETCFGDAEEQTSRENPWDLRHSGLHSVKSCPVLLQLASLSLQRTASTHKGARVVLIGMAPLTQMQEIDVPHKIYVT
jgi:hypothetical protein